MNKELGTHSPMDCEPEVKRKMADCRLRLEAARFEAKKVVTRLLRDHEACIARRQAKGEGTRYQDGAGVEKKPTTSPKGLCRSALEACGWKRTTRVRGSQKKTGPDPPKVCEKGDTPRAHPQDPIGSKG